MIGGRPRGMASRRHSDRRATTWRKDNLQLAAVGLKGPWGKQGLETRKMKRFTIIKDLMERSLAQIKGGLSESDILRYEQERNED